MLGNSFLDGPSRSMQLLFFLHLNFLVPERLKPGFLLSTLSWTTLTFLQNPRVSDA